MCSIAVKDSVGSIRGVVEKPLASVVVREASKSVWYFVKQEVLVVESWVVLEAVGAV